MLVTKTFDEIVQDMIKVIKNNQLKVSDYSVGSVMRAIIDALAMEINENYYSLYNDYINQYVETAIGSDLDKAIIPLTVTRRPETYAAGYISIENTTPATQDVPVPIGTVVQTGQDQSGNVKEYETIEFKMLRTGDVNLKAKAIDIRYDLPCMTAVVAVVDKRLTTYINGTIDLDIDLTDVDYDQLIEVVNYIKSVTGYYAAINAESTDIQASQDLFAVTNQNIKGVVYSIYRKDRIKIQAKTIGIDGNTGEYTIVGLKVNISGIQSITNDQAVAGGMAEEDDETLRERAKNQMTVLSVGLPEQFEKWALEADDSIIRAKTQAGPQGTGQVFVILVTTSGPASTDIVNSAQNYINAKRNPVTVFATKTFQYVPIDMTCTITIRQGYTSSKVESLIKETLRKLFSYTTWPFGKEVRKSQLIDTIINVSGVYAIEISVPVEEVTLIAVDQMPALGIFTAYWQTYTGE